MPLRYFFRLAPFFLASFLCLDCYSQTLTITHFPEDNQLIPRNPTTNTGTYYIQGSVQQGVSYQSIFVKVFRDSAVYFQQNIPFTFQGGVFNFSVPIFIPAELVNYRVELYTVENQQLSLARAAVRIVSGDVIAVNGQSNNIGTIDSVNWDDFMRSHTNQFGWNDIRYTQPGRWPPRLAKAIITQNHIPVALFNESVGGQTEDFYLKQDTSLTAGNYGTLYTRLRDAEVLGNVRALFWWQGESDGWVTNPDTFKNNFKKLVAAWRQDYPNTQLYYYQVRFHACGHVNPQIMDEQRQIYNQVPGLEVFSVTDAESDGCHFYYNNGYDSIGNRAYRLYSAKNYGSSFTNTRPPNVDTAWFSGPREITLRFRNVTGDLRIIGSPWKDFRFNTDSVQVTGGSASGNLLKLTWAGDTLGPPTISYLAHLDTSTNWIVNPLGVGLLTFLDIPIQKNVPTPDSNLAIPFNPKIYPTASTGLFTVQQDPTNESSLKVSVMDIRGVVVQTQNISQSTQTEAIDISYLPKGMYFVSLQNPQNKFVAFKIVKM